MAVSASNVLIRRNNFFCTVLLTLFLSATLSVVKAEQEMPMAHGPSQQLNERRLSVDGRDMVHMHLHTTPLYGNSTDFMYYYITAYFGSHRQP